MVNCPLQSRKTTAFRQGTISMTGYTVHTGSTKKFASNWDEIFAKPGAKKQSAGKPAAAKSATKSATESAGKRAAKSKKAT